jgi:hypothetical protein
MRPIRCFRKRGIQAPAPALVEDARVLELLNGYALRFTFLRSPPHIPFAISVIARKVRAARPSAIASLRDCGIVLRAGRTLATSLEVTEPKEARNSGPESNAISSERPSTDTDRAVADLNLGDDEQFTVPGIYNGGDTLSGSFRDTSTVLGLLGLIASDPGIPKSDSWEGSGDDDVCQLWGNAGD